MNTEFILTKTFPFEAAHRLDFHDGKCARLHGHSFKLTVVVGGENLQFANKAKRNMLFDYGDISAIVKPFVEEKLDHHFLNETLVCNMPTSEFIAKHCFDHLWTQFRKLNIELREVRISETCTSEAIYRKI